MITYTMFGIDMTMLNEISMIARVLLATVLSLALGFERVRKRRAAGARTYMLVCVGAALAMMTGQYVMQTYSPNSDAMRIGAQVVSGIGFIGAGTILVTGQLKVKGLTTAAGLWAVACIGLAVGAGFYLGAVVVAVVILLAMTIMDVVQSKLERRMKRMQVYAIFTHISQISPFLEFARQKALDVSDFETLRVEGGEGIGANFTIKLKERMHHADILASLGEFTGITFIEEL